jgi:hypothetical protein
MILTAACDACGKTDEVSAGDVAPHLWFQVSRHRRAEYKPLPVLAFCSEACLASWATKRAAEVADAHARQREQAWLATELRKHAEPSTE